MGQVSSLTLEFGHFLFRIAFDLPFFVGNFVGNFVVSKEMSGFLEHSSEMFTHHKLMVYHKALACAGSAEEISSGWARKHAFVDHFCRASESIVLNLAEGARLRSGPAKLITLDYAIGSALEGAACMDIARVKELLPVLQVSAQKQRLWEITRMLIGLRKSWGHEVMNEEPTAPEPKDGEPLFHHETLDVYRVGLEFMRWSSSLPGSADLCDRTFRHLDSAATSLLLNMAEGNGRYSELDHRRFLDVAAAAAVKSAVYLDLCEHRNSPIGMDASVGRNLLGRVTAMLSRF